jgi:hypothetical protein
VIEHYPELIESAFAEIDGRTLLVGRCASGEYRVFDQLIFHGGTGSTLERRIFSDESIRANLAAAGFPTVKIDATGNREFGVVFSSPCSIPIVAICAPFVLNASGITELLEQLSSARSILSILKSSRWLRLGKILGVGPDLK